MRDFAPSTYSARPQHLELRDGAEGPSQALLLSCSDIVAGVPSRALSVTCVNSARDVSDNFCTASCLGRPFKTAVFNEACTATMVLVWPHEPSPMALQPPKVVVAGP